jgi:hypothetical protein
MPGANEFRLRCVTRWWVVGAHSRRQIRISDQPSSKSLSGLNAWTKLTKSGASTVVL